ncbi:arginine deiminase family protein [Sedimentibacter sp.]|uniref:dimethylarginine dimethylaminohydrolase family protein n=1 Tax=Sedimentibacter sp. TaxID=1960295 RepID=UPI000EEFE91B|nr:arginine deiminase family protein [Sedimentibacter sp.]HCX62915.1 amidinotransferase [Clostridiales bacterium]
MNKDIVKIDIDAIPGERWFPNENSFKDEIDLYWGDWGVASEVEDLKAVLMRRPGKEIENFDYKEVRFKEPINVDLFRKQHDDLAEIYSNHGVKVYYVKEQRGDRPNALFMRDLVFMTPEGAIVTRPAIAARRGEERYAAKALSDLGVPILKTVTGNGTFDGAMGLWIDKHTVVLASGVRCNKDGYQQVEYELKRIGVDNIIHMQIPYGHAHIDGLLNIASNDTAMIHASQVPYDVCEALKRKGFKLLEAPSQTEAKETLGINFVAIKPGLVVQPEGNPRCKELLENNGIKVISTDFFEILKGWGAIHCVTAFLKRG